MASRLSAFVALAALLAWSAAALEFEHLTARDGLAILRIHGNFESGDADKLRAALRGRQVDEVWFHSGGGVAAEGFAIGRILRERGLIARIPRGHICASACVSAFIGAPIRFVDHPLSVGVHPGSVSRSERARQIVREAIEKDGDEGARDVISAFERRGSAFAAEWISYVLEMGVSSRLVSHASSVEFRCMLFLSDQEMRYFNVVNTAGPPPPGYRPGDGCNTCTARNNRCQ